MTDRMLPTDRLAYDPIEGRARLALPDGARLACWVIVNVEEWDATQKMPRTVLPPPAGGEPSPDIPNWAWHEYGNRVGFWRLARILDEFGVTASLAINGAAIAAYPPIVEAAKSRGWEFMGHGFTQRNMQRVEDERADIRRTAEAVERATGRRPRGWLGPGLTETWETPDLLVEEGYDYVCDWVLDEQPVRLATRSGPIVSIPYTQEINDVAMMAVQHHTAVRVRSAAPSTSSTSSTPMPAPTARRAIMALVVHPYLMGVAHRARHFRAALAHIARHADVLFWTGEQICEWYVGERP